MTTTTTVPTLLRAERNDAGEPVRVWLSTTFDAKGDATPAREVAGVFAPYEAEIDRLNWLLGTTRFRIEADALTVRDDAKAFYGHDWLDGGMPIGRVASSASDATALTGALALSKTAKADEVYALCLDGTLDRFSVGFNITEYRIEDADTATACLVVVAGDVFEVSIVPYPALDGAAVQSVNSSTPTGRNTMTQSLAAPTAPETTEPTAADFAALHASVETLTRQMATLGDTITEDRPTAVPFSSYGEYVKAMLNSDHDGHQAAQDFAVSLAYGDADGEGTVGDTTYDRGTWVGDVIRLIERARKVWNLFDSAPLPSEGMKLEYGKIVNNTINVAQQLTEGSPLVMGQIEVGSDFADVITFGGASKQSFQQAQRSNVQVLDLTWRALAIAYAKATEQYSRALLANPAKVAPQAIGTLADLDDLDGWTEWFIDVALHFDEKGLVPEYIRLTPDVYKGLATLRVGPDGPLFLDRSTGTLNLPELTGNVNGLPIVLVPGTDLVEVGHSSAIKTFESSGAPARLGPEKDILTLTQAIGVYGFDAVAVVDEKAIVRAATA